MNGKHRASLEHRIRRLAGKAIGDFGLIVPGDRILVALSGGKDSWTLLHVLERLRRRAPIAFTLHAVTVHPGFPGFRTDGIEAYCRNEGYDHHVLSAPIHQLMLEKLGPDETGCALCSRIRRGILYTAAREMACTKIALGHHRDDLIETLLLNQFFNGRIKAMAPLLRADDKVNTVIRPLVYASEDDIARFAAAAGFPVACCACPACGDPDLQRPRIKALLERLEREHPGIKANLLAALGAIDERHLLLRDRSWNAVGAGRDPD